MQASATRRSLTTLFAVLVATAASGCAQTVILRVDRPTRVVFDGEDLGVVTPEEPAEVEVSPGIGDVPYGIEVGGQRFDGKIERGSLSPLLASVGLTGACVALPTCLLAGLCATNPTLMSAPLCGAACVFGGFFTALEALYGCAAQFCLSPGWLTAPAVAGSLAAGASPLMLLGVRHIPDELVLTPGGAFNVAAWERRRERPAPERLAADEVAF
jgi:hypothetical protein